MTPSDLPAEIREEIINSLWEISTGEALRPKEEWMVPAEDATAIAEAAFRLRLAQGAPWSLIHALERACWKRKWSEVKKARKSLEAEIGPRPHDPLFTVQRLSDLRGILSAEAQDASTPAQVAEPSDDRLAFSTVREAHAEALEQAAEDGALWFFEDSGDVKAWLRARASALRAGTTTT